MTVPKKSPDTTRSLAAEFARVKADLDDPKSTGKRRLELLRRQADLGDLREALADRGLPRT
jgi:hypothetical protein